MKVVVLLLILIYDSEAHITCDNPVSNISFTTIPRIEYPNSRTKRAAQNIRITPYYDSSFNALSNKDDIIRLIITPAIQFWRDALIVKNPLTSPLLIDRSCPNGFNIVNNVKVCDGSCSNNTCYTTLIPSQFTKKCYTGNSVRYSESGSEGSGAPDTDLLLMVTQKSTRCGSSNLAYSVSCEVEHGHDRPVLGLINICPGKIDTVTGVREAIAILKHEMAHILGISPDVYAFYRDECDNPRTTRDSNGFPNLGQKTIGTVSIYQYSDSTIKDISKTYNYRGSSITRTVSFIVTSTIRDEIRKHFNCPTLEGMPLEDYGSEYSALSHFENLYLQTEIMTGVIADIPKVSRLTMAVLQDTGWYNVNFDKAEYFDYGKNLGCDLVTQSCYEFIINKQASSSSIVPYCNTARPSTVKCGSDSTIIEYCNLNVDSTAAASIPSNFKYFSDFNLVSNDPFGDYCPVIVSTVCNNANVNIDPQCNNADRPCKGVMIFTGTCPTTTTSTTGSIIIGTGSTSSTSNTSTTRKTSTRPTTRGYVIAVFGCFIYILNRKL